MNNDSNFQVYKLLKFPIIDPIKHPPEKKKLNDHDTLAIAKDAIKNNRYIYLDLQDNEGYKMLEKVDVKVSNADEIDEYAERISNNVVVTKLQNLSMRGQQMFKYLNRLKSISRNNEQINNFMQIRRKQSTYQLSDNQVHNLESQKLKQYLEERNFENISNGLVEKQLQLCKKVSMISEINFNREKNNKSENRVKKDSDIDKFKNLLSNIKQEVTSPKRLEYFRFPSVDYKSSKYVTRPRNKN